MNTVNKIAATSVLAFVATSTSISFAAQRAWKSDSSTFTIVSTGSAGVKDASLAIVKKDTQQDLRVTKKSLLYGFTQKAGADSAAWVSASDLAGVTGATPGKVTLELSAAGKAALSYLHHRELVITPQAYKVTEKVGGGDSTAFTIDGGTDKKPKFKSRAQFTLRSSAVDDSVSSNGISLDDSGGYLKIPLCNTDSNAFCLTYHAQVYGVGLKNDNSSKDINRAVYTGAGINAHMHYTTDAGPTLAFVLVPDKLSKLYTDSNIAGVFTGWGTDKTDGFADAKAASKASVDGLSGNDLNFVAEIDVMFSSEGV